MWEVPEGSACFGMAQAAFLEQWEEGNMALRRAQSCSMGAPDWQEGSGKMCCFEGGEVQHQSKLHPSHPARCLFGNLGLWVLWGGQHKISSPSKTIQPLNPKGITALGMVLHLRSPTGSLKILIWLLGKNLIWLPECCLNWETPKPARNISYGVIF